MAICDGAGVTVIEDCAHTMGATWRGVPSGRHGRGGLLFDADLQAHEFGRGRVSGHRRRRSDGARGDPVGLLHAVRPAPRRAAARGFRDDPATRPRTCRAAWTTCAPRSCARNCAPLSGSMRPLERTATACSRTGLRDTPGLRLIDRPEAESFVGSSFQFLLPDWHAGGGRGRGDPLQGARGRAEMVRRGGPGGLHVAL